MALLILARRTEYAEDMVTWRLVHGVRWHLEFKDGCTKLNGYEMTVDSGVFMTEVMSEMQRVATEVCERVGEGCVPEAVDDHQPEVPSCVGTTFHVGGTYDVLCRCPDPPDTFPPPRKWFPWSGVLWHNLMKRFKKSWTREPRVPEDFDQALMQI